MMQLHLLGTAGFHPNEQRQTSCLFLPQLGIMLDAGTGAFRARELLATSTLDIFLTHAHLDHVVGLTYLIDILAGKAMQRVTVHGEIDKIASLDKHLFAPELFPVPPAFQWQPLKGLVSLPEHGTLTHFPVEHPGGAVGFRLDWPGHSLAYVTDTTAKTSARYVQAIAGVDLLIHECNFSDGQEAWAAKTGHSCTSAVAQVAAQAGVKKLVLTHFNPLETGADPIGLAAARQIFPATELGLDGSLLEF